MSACGAPPVAAPAPSLALLRRPPSADDAQTAFHRFAGELFEASKAGRLEETLVSELELRTLLAPESATRASQVRASGHIELARSTAVAVRAWNHSTFRAACGQGAYDEAAGGRLGLTDGAWVVERILLVGVDAASGPVAGWIEGRFVLTNRGFVAVEIVRLEAPRPHHSDLELASCEISTGWEVHNRLGLSSPEIH